MWLYDEISKCNNIQIYITQIQCFAFIVINDRQSHRRRFVYLFLWSNKLCLPHITVTLLVIILIFFFFFVCIIRFDLVIYIRKSQRRPSFTVFTHNHRPCETQKREKKYEEKRTKRSERAISYEFFNLFNDIFLFLVSGH